MGRQRWHTRTRRDARGLAPAATGWTPGLYPFAFAHATGFGAVPPVAALEAAGWTTIKPLAGLAGFYLLRRATTGGD